MSDAQNNVRDLLHRIAKEQNIQNYELKINPISTGGANYSSILYLATINNGTQHLDLFIKELALKGKMREELPMKIFETEIHVYTELKSLYRALEEKHKVPEKHRLYLPKYYGGNAKYLEEILVFEDLGKRGFSCHNRQISIDCEYAVAAVTELAKLHALSIAFHKESPVEFQHFIDEYIEEYLNEKFVDEMWRKGFETTLQVIREENVEKLKRFFANVDLAWIRKMNEPLKCKVLAHGDYRQSNLMHKRRNEGRSGAKSRPWKLELYYNLLNIMSTR